MRTTRTLVLIPALAVALVACSDDGDSTATSAAPVTEAVADSTTPADTAAPGASTGDTQPTTGDTAASGPVQIDVVVGTDSGPDRVVKVKVGAEITLNITNPAAADEFHVHGIDLEQAVDAGVTATLNFTADTVGEIEVESHITEDVLVVIEVV